MTLPGMGSGLIQGYAHAVLIKVLVLDVREEKDDSLLVSRPHHVTCTRACACTEHATC